MFALLIDAATRSLALAFVVWIAIAVLRPRDPQLQLTIWRVVLIAALLMPLALLCLPLLASGARLPESMPLQTELINAVSRVEWHDRGGVFYLAVAAAMFLRELVSLCRGWQVARRAVSLTLTDAPDLHVRSGIDILSPVTFGSTVLLPADSAGWSTAKRRAVIAHESKHVANGDFYFRLAARLYRAFFWFDPLAWILPRHLMLLEEQVSDDAGAGAMSDRAAYAALLLSLADRSSVGSRDVAMTGGTLEQRIERLLDPDKASRPVTRRRRIVISLLMMPFITYATAAGVDAAAYRCRQRAGDERSFVTSFGNCSAPASSPTLPLSLPSYPPASRRSGETGTVVLQLLVRADGGVETVRVVRSSGYAQLDDAAADEAHRWRMTPGSVGGRPIDSWGRFAVTFQLAR